MVDLFVAFLFLGANPFKNDLEFVINSKRFDSVVINNLSHFSFDEINETKIVALALIRLYQLFISSQDVPACQFTPTCSRFTFTAIKRYGLLWGVIMGSDRLQRCHNWSRLYYPLDPETDRCLDPPDKEWLWFR